VSATKLDPDLLRACAACLANVVAYPPGDGQLAAALREDARATEEFGDSVTDEWLDELTLAHLTAVRGYGKRRRPTSVGTKTTARAILDATPSMLRWWCDRLVEAG
jgi:hypothetical protein